MSEFNLSEKIKNESECGVKFNEDYILTKNVKEFVRLLKEEGYCENCGHKYKDKIKPPAFACCPETSWVVRLSKADKLAGEELSNVHVN